MRWHDAARAGGHSPDFVESGGPVKDASVPTATRVVLLRSFDMGEWRISYLKDVAIGRLTVA